MKYKVFLLLFLVVLMACRDSKPGSKLAYPAFITQDSMVFVSGFEHYVDSFTRAYPLSREVYQISVQQKDAYSLRYFISKASYFNLDYNPPPLYYMLHKGLPVIFFTGIEHCLKYDTASFRIFNNFLLNYSIDTARILTHTYHPPIWRIDVHDGVFEIQDHLVDSEDIHTISLDKSLW